MKTTKKVSGNARYFLALKVSNDVRKFVSVRESSKIIVNKSRLEITVLLVIRIRLSFSLWKTLSELLGSLTPIWWAKGKSSFICCFICFKVF